MSSASSLLHEDENPNGDNASVESQQGEGVTITLKEYDFSIGDIEILHNLSVSFIPGELTAIIGPSGSGKSTLINCMVRLAKGTEKGSLLYNGNEVGIADIRRNRLIAYVRSSDVLMPYLTCQQTIKYSALMHNQTRHETKNTVEKLLYDLRLQGCRNTKVGGMFNRGLSSGEKRRLSIAQEVVCNPEVLILDEPTTGLDAVSASMLIPVLSELAHVQNKTVIASVHQPSSFIFGAFDKVVVLAEGRIAYIGAPSSMMRILNGRLEKLSLTPYTRPINPADFALDLVYPEASGSGERDPLDDRVLLTREQLEGMIELHMNSSKHRDSQQTHDHWKNNPAELKGATEASWWWWEFIVAMERDLLHSIGEIPLLCVLTSGQILLGVIFGSFWKDIGGGWVKECQPVDVNGNPSAGTLPVPNGEDVGRPAGCWRGDDLTPRRLTEDELAVHLTTREAASAVERAVSIAFAATKSDSHYNELLAAVASRLPKLDVSLDVEGKCDSLMSDNCVEDGWFLPTSYDDESVSDLLTCINNNFLTLGYRGGGEIRYPDTFINSKSVAGIHTTAEFLAGVDWSEMPHWEIGVDGHWIGSDVSVDVGSATGVGLRWWLKAATCYERELTAITSCFSLPDVGLSHWISTINDLLENYPAVSTAMKNAGLDLTCNRETNLLPDFESIISSFTENTSRVEPSGISMDLLNALQDCASSECLVAASAVRTMSGMSSDVRGIITFPTHEVKLGYWAGHTACCFLMWLIPCFGGLVSTWRATKDRMQMNRESTNGWYRLSACFMATQFSQIPFLLFPPFMAFVACYHMMGWDLSYAYQVYPMAALQIWTIAGIFMGFGFLLPNATTAAAVAPFLVMMFIATSGFFIRARYWPNWLTWTMWLSPMYWPFSWQIMWMWPRDGTWGGLTNNYMHFIVGILNPDTFDMKEPWYAMFIMGVLYRIAAVVCLLCLHRNQGLDS